MTGQQLLDAQRQLGRNGRWGTCADCPRNGAGDAFPEDCNNTVRYDHLLDDIGLRDLASRVGINDWSPKDAR